MKQTEKISRSCEATQAAARRWKEFLQLTQVDRDEDMSGKELNIGKE